MAVPAKRKSSNIVLSINRFVRDNFATPNSVTVNYQDRAFDSSDKDLWVDVSVLNHGAGRKGETLVQFDVYSRIEGPVPGGDQYGQTLAETVDKLHAAMHVDTVPVYDFSTPTSPSATGSVLIVQNSAGKLREPEDDRELFFEDGVARRSVTYRFVMAGDLSRSPSYYD